MFRKYSIARRHDHTVHMHELKLTAVAHCKKRQDHCIPISHEAIVRAFVNHSADLGKVSCVCCFRIIAERLVEFPSAILMHHNALGARLAK